jgi:hypothetical protein
MTVLHIGVGGKIIWSKTLGFQERNTVENNHNFSRFVSISTTFASRFLCASLSTSCIHQLANHPTTILMDAAAITTKSPAAALDAAAITTKNLAAAAATEIVEFLDLTQDDDAPHFTAPYVTLQKFHPKSSTAAYSTPEQAMEALLKNRLKRKFWAARNNKRYKATVIDLTAMEDPAALTADPASDDSTVEYEVDTVINLTAMEDDDPAALTADPASDDSTVEYEVEDETFYIDLTPPYYNIALAADPTSDASSVYYSE